MKILAIETSCDETAISIAEFPKTKKLSFKDFKILSNIVSSQIEIHKNYGGVYPFLAKREHYKNLVPVLIEALKEAKLLKKKKNLKKIKESPFTKLKFFLENYSKPDIDLMAVTQGPGLEPCLWAGINLAQTLSSYWKIPVIPINHIEAHLLVNFKENEIEFPAVALIVSGGHTQLILMKKLGEYKLLGETRDDAAGEAFDKIAKTLNLSYPGGPAISKEAEKYKKAKFNINLPKPMFYSKDYDFSFSGLKTAVLYDYKKRTNKIRKSKGYIQEMSFQSQKSIIDVLIKKTVNAAKEFKTKSIILGGGVTANKRLREEMEKEVPLKNLKIFIPEISLCTDNAEMIALTAYYYWNKNVKIKKDLKAYSNLNIS